MHAKTDNETDQWKNRFDAFRFISETHRALREHRRGTQHQVFFTTLTFYALIGAAKFTGKLQAYPSHRVCFLVVAWLLILGTAVLSSAYLLGLHAANRVNRGQAQRAEREIRRMVGLEGPEDTGKWIAKTYFWQISMIVIFAIGVGLSITMF